MIKNERQYRITKAQADKFQQALVEFLDETQLNTHIHPLLRTAQREALQSQLADLQAQIEEYEALRSGKYKVVETHSIEELPRVLIQARIASGFSQKDLAERLGLKEQQVQRYEATEYAEVSFKRLKEVINVLGVKIQENIFLPEAQITASLLLKRLKVAGLENDLVKNRLIPSSLWERLQEAPTGVDISESVLKVASIIGRIFDWQPADIFNSTPLELDMTTIGITRYKKPVRASERRTNAYTVYAHYLALLVHHVTHDLPKQPVPTNASEVRKTILSQYGSITLKNVLDYSWSLGIPVLPLHDPGSFHGACWRVQGRNVIVLKQHTLSESRWLFDFLHELRHAGQEPDKDNFDLIEAHEIGQGKQDKEEKVASQFAGNVLLDGRATELAEKCVQLAGNSVERLKTVVPQVAAEENVLVDSLANYVAFRLSLQDLNWWGTAQNLQTSTTPPWQVARDVFLGHVNLAELNEIDRGLLQQALSSVEV